MLLKEVKIRDFPQKIAALIWVSFKTVVTPSLQECWDETFVTPFKFCFFTFRVLLCVLGKEVHKKNHNFCIALEPPTPPMEETQIQAAFFRGELN